MYLYGPIKCRLFQGPFHAQTRKLSIPDHNSYIGSYWYKISEEMPDEWCRRMALGEDTEELPRPQRAAYVWYGDNVFVHDPERTKQCSK